MATPPGFLPGESHGQRSLAGYSPGGCKESDTTERLNNNNNDKALAQADARPATQLSSGFSLDWPSHLLKGKQIWAEEMVFLRPLGLSRADGAETDPHSSEQREVCFRVCFSGVSCVAAGAALNLSGSHFLGCNTSTLTAPQHPHPGSHFHPDVEKSFQRSLFGAMSA